MTSLDHIGDMVIINFNVVEGADTTDDAIGHGDNPHLQTAAELHIRRMLATAQMRQMEAKKVGDGFAQG